MAKAKRNKLGTPLEAAAHIHSGDSIMIGGFGVVGVPDLTMQALLTETQDRLTIIGNDGGRPGTPRDVLMGSGRVSKLIASYVGTNPNVTRYVQDGTMELEMVPQGTLVERIRSGGYGLGGVLTPAGVGTVLSKGKQELNIEGKRYLLETPLKANVALVRASRADSCGNLSYSYVGKNYNPYMAMAADYVIAEVDEYIEDGYLSDHEVETPGILVDMILVREDIG